MCSAVVNTNKVNFKDSPNVIFFLPFILYESSIKWQ